MLWLTRFRSNGSKSSIILLGDGNLSNLVSLRDYQVLKNESLEAVSGGKRKEMWYEAIGDGVVSLGQGFLEAF